MLRWPLAGELGRGRSSDPESVWSSPSPSGRCRGSPSRPPAAVPGCRPVSAAAGIRDRSGPGPCAEALSRGAAAPPWSPPESPGPRSPAPPLVTAGRGRGACLGGPAARRRGQLTRSRRRTPSLLSVAASASSPVPWSSWIATPVPTEPATTAVDDARFQRRTGAAAGGTRRERPGRAAGPGGRRLGAVVEQHPQQRQRHEHPEAVAERLAGAVDRLACAAAAEARARRRSRRGSGLPARASRSPPAAARAGPAGARSAPTAPRAPRPRPRCRGRPRSPRRASRWSAGGRGGR